MTLFCCRHGKKLKVSSPETCRNAESSKVRSAKTPNRPPNRIMPKMLKSVASYPGNPSSEIIPSTSTVDHRPPPLRSSVRHNTSTSEHSFHQRSAASRTMATAMQALKGDAPQQARSLVRSAQPLCARPRRPPQRRARERALLLTRNQNGSTASSCDRASSLRPITSGTTRKGERGMRSGSTSTSRTRGRCRS